MCKLSETTIISTRKLPYNIERNKIHVMWTKLNQYGVEAIVKNVNCVRKFVYRRKLRVQTDRAGFPIFLPFRA